MSDTPRIIIPGDARAVPESNRPKFNLPQEMKDEVRKFVPEAKEIADKVHALLSKGHAAQVAMVCQEPFRMFLGEHIKAILPQIARTLAHTDRMQILGFFRQIADQRISTANISAEKIDRVTYELAISDFMSLISRVPAQVFPIEIGLPDLDVDSPESEIPPTDRNQGET